MAGSLSHLSLLFLASYYLLPSACLFLYLGTLLMQLRSTFFCLLLLNSTSSHPAFFVAIFMPIHAFTVCSDLFNISIQLSLTSSFSLPLHLHICSSFFKSLSFSHYILNWLWQPCSSVFILQAFSSPYWQCDKQNYTSSIFLSCSSVSHSLKPWLFTFTATTGAYLDNKHHIDVLPTVSLAVFPERVKTHTVCIYLSQICMQLQKTSRV